MSFTLSSSFSGHEDLGCGVTLNVTTNFASIKDSPEKMTFKVNVTLNHFNAIAAMECFRTEMNKDASDKEKEAFILSSVKKFKKENYETIKIAMTAFSHETMRVFQSMMDEIKELRDQVNLLHLCVVGAVDEDY